MEDGGALARVLGKSVTDQGRTMLVPNNIIVQFSNLLLVHIITVDLVAEGKLSSCHTPFPHTWPMIVRRSPLGASQE
jgi:hypothetical protein